MEVEQFMGPCTYSVLSSSISDVANWWNTLKSERQNTAMPIADDSETYLNILKFYFHQMFIQKDILTRGKPRYKFIGI
jgi:hypothetical protein